MTDTERNRQLITDAFEAFVSGERKPFFDLVADDVRWTVIGSTGISGTFGSKRSFIADASSKLFEGLDGPLTGSVVNVLADGDHVVVQWEGTAPTTAGGRYEQTYCWVMRMTGGLIVETVAYLDTEMITSVLGGSGSTLGLSADEVLTTTRAVRKRIDFDRPVERQVVLDCVEIAHQAPTGSNNQGWRWVLVDDPETKAGLADLYRASFYPYVGLDDPGTDDLPDRDDAQGNRILASAVYMARRLHEVPLMAVPCHVGRLEGANSFGQASAWGSILPAVWSFLLALRERGIGSSWTTLHLPKEREAAELLGIPYDDYTQVGLFPIGYTLGTGFKPATRLPAADFVHWNRW